MKNYEINFESIPLDLEPDENITLWRYMSFSSLCEILMNNHIPLIRISNFSDKSEGAILKGILSKLPNTYEDSIQYAMQKYYEATYISSWHQSVNENAAMWDRYTYGGEGVGIKTNARLLLDCISAIEANHISHHESFSDANLGVLAEGKLFNPHIIIKPIKYTDNKPTDFEMERKYLRNGYDKLCFFYKLEDFEDESEIRILRSESHAYIFSQLHPSTFYEINEDIGKFIKIQNPSQLKIDSAGKLIQQIVVSPHAHNQFIKTVQQSIEHINVYRQRLQTDLIKCDVIESRRKEWV